MKKYLIIALMFMLLVIPAVSAENFWSGLNSKQSLYQKNETWHVIEGGSYGELTFSTVVSRDRVRQDVKATAWKLRPRTSYQLIYYGNQHGNDVWPYATCIGKAKMTNTQGFFKGLGGTFNYLGMFNDQVPQKFRVVLASDINCAIGNMTTWNHRAYLYESYPI